MATKSNPTKGTITKAKAAALAKAIVDETAEYGGRLPAETVAARAAIITAALAAPVGTVTTVPDAAKGRSKAARTPAGQRSAAESLRAYVLRLAALADYYGVMIITGDPDTGVTITTVPR